MTRNNKSVADATKEIKCDDCGTPLIFGSKQFRNWSIVDTYVCPTGDGGYLHKEAKEDKEYQHEFDKAVNEAQKAIIQKYIIEKGIKISKEVVK